MKRTLLSDLLYIYNTIDCEKKCTVYCPNKSRCDTLKDLIKLLAKYSYEVIE